MNILIIDDDADLRTSLGLALEDAGHTVQKTGDMQVGLRLAEWSDAVVTDVMMPPADDAGLHIVREVHRRFPTTEVLVMTGYGSIPQAVEAMRLGARTYLQKPFPTATLLHLLAEIGQMRGLREGISGRGSLVGSSALMRKVYGAIDIAAACDLPVLLHGDTGTGKELAAQAIHQLSKRRSRPYIPVNCAAIPRELAESELFGHEAGAFTGATTRREGRFLLASGGTLFLDEINSLPLDLQPKLLRTLETGDIWPVGAREPLRAQVRIIAATNADPQELVAAGRFRADLYYRLNALAISLPSLRERVEDIPAIATCVLERDPELGSRAILTADALGMLLAHPWPGNVRELANAVRRAAVIAAAGVPADAIVAIRAEHLDLPGSIPGIPFKQAQEQATEEWTRRTVLAALTRTNGNIPEAARLLVMDRTAIYRTLKRLGIATDGAGQASRNGRAMPTLPSETSGPPMPAATLGSTGGHGDEPSATPWSPRAGQARISVR